MREVKQPPRLTKWSVVWIIAGLLLVPYEILMIVTHHEGGPLTDVVRWAYGPERSVRWWLVGCTTTGFILWMAPHFLFAGWGGRQLVYMVGIGFAVGVAGIILTHP